MNFKTKYSRILFILLVLFSNTIKTKLNTTVDQRKRALKRLNLRILEEKEEDRSPANPKEDWGSIMDIELEPNAIEEPELPYHKKDIKKLTEEEIEEKKINGMNPGQGLQGNIYYY